MAVLLTPPRPQTEGKQADNGDVDGENEPPGEGPWTSPSLLPQERRVQDGKNFMHNKRAELPILDKTSCKTQDESFN